MSISHSFGPAVPEILTLASGYPGFWRQGGQDAHGQVCTEQTEASQIREGHHPSPHVRARGHRLARLWLPLRRCPGQRGSTAELGHPTCRGQGRVGRLEGPQSQDLEKGRQSHSAKGGREANPVWAEAPGLPCCCAVPLAFAPKIKVLGISRRQQQSLKPSVGPSAPATSPRNTWTAFHRFQNSFMSLPVFQPFNSLLHSSDLVSFKPHFSKDKALR